ncbi:MAG: hypothetical protein G01um10143_669 [Parcubacteria group bacterium Gr01-1014_3]|nr:MAG: hypothetical protein G01um10143_669 [Parcubacteria group bacterium Gr01-1014_3]
MLIQVLLEAIMIVAIFSILWLAVVRPILRLIGNKDTGQFDERDPKYGAKLRKKLDELKKKQKELEELAHQDVAEQLAELDAEILRLRNELAEFDSGRWEVKDK